jgi:hypothetical protein
MKKLAILLMALIVILSSCASSKTFQIDGQAVEVKPYGWANKEARYNDKVVYEVSLGNVIWSAIGIETIVLPVWLTGWQLWQPVKLKEKLDK